MSKHSRDSAIADPAICGQSWQASYFNYFETTNERLITLPPHQRRLLLSVAVRAGPADIYLGIVTWFLFALVSKRLFYYIPLRGEHNHSFDVELVYHPASFDWSSGLKLNLSEQYYQCLMPPYDEDHESCLIEGPMFSPDTTNSTFEALNYVNKQLNSFQSGNITEDTDLINVVQVVSNRGYVYSLFDNPLYNQTLAHMGLKRDTAFSCLFNYLFKLDPKVCSKNVNCVKAESAIVAAQNSGAVLISIQYRVKFSNKGNAYYSFICAEQLANEYRAESKKVVFILITDDLSTQEWAKAKYNDSVILPSWSPQKPEFVMDALEKTKDHRKQSVIDASRDMHISSLADVHIVSEHSGFGLVAALMRIRPEEEIVIHYMGSHTCSKKQPAPLKHFASIWSGL